MNEPIVYVVERFPERSQTFLQNELRELARHSIRPQIFALYPPSDLDRDAGDLAFERLPSLADRPAELLRALVSVAVRHPAGLTRAAIVAGSRPSRLQAHAFAKAVLLTARLRVRPARIHAHFARASASTALLAGVITGSPFSFTAHALDIFVKPFDVDRKLRRADVTVTVCEYNRRFIEERWPGLGHLQVIPCGVDPGVLARRTQYRNEPFVVVAIGRLVPKKGFDVLVRAIADLHARDIPVRCRILGEGPQRPHLETLITALDAGDYVALEGSAAAAQVREALETATVFCLPALIAEDGDRDSQPVVIKEAMAMEVPVVATATVGIPEMVDDSLGRLVAPGDVTALVGALLECASLPVSALRSMGSAARQRVEDRFSLERQVSDLLACWSVGPEDSV